MFELKNYQRSALNAVDKFLTQCAEGKTAADVFEAAYEAAGVAKAHYADYFHGKPCICLRVPTGGGKTVIAACAIHVIDFAYCGTGAPVVLWLTPSDTITTQTLSALQNPDHPYRQAIEQKFRSVRVVGVDEVPSIPKSEFRETCIIIVATIQTFNVGDTKIRNAYGFNEALEPFFVDLPESRKTGLERVSKEDVPAEDGSVLTPRNVGDVKYSLANLLHLFEPIIIVDEAHNNRTDRFFKTLNRLNPSVVLELTATPIKGKNNVIYQVSAWELKAENMIKLPIILGEFTVGWERCIDESVKIRESLEADAANETDGRYLRPILLIQAQKKGSEPSPEAVKRYLMETLSISENEIAIATGTHKELNGIDLFDPKCPIRYVITIQALKEGWDCSFAYVLCSLQNIQSSKDTEQLLGRVLRMPYATRRSMPSLNRAYANVVSERTWEAVQLLKDGLVENLGFNHVEAQSLVETQPEDPPEPPLFGENDTPLAPQPRYVDAVFTTDEEPERAIAQCGLADKVRVAPARMEGRAILRVDTTADSEKLRRLERAFSEKTNKAGREWNEEALRGIFAGVSRGDAELNQSTPFPDIPRLFYMADGVPRLLTPETVMADPWNPLDYSKHLDFRPRENVSRYEIDSQSENRVLVSEQISELELPFRYSDVEATPDALVRWVADRVARPDVLKPVMVRFVEAVCAGLMDDQGFSLVKLYAHKVELARAVTELLKANYKEAVRFGFERCLDLAAPLPASGFPSSAFVFRFDPLRYEPRKNFYDNTKGGRSFKKHVTSVIDDLQYKTPGGEVSEEYLCAEAIEANRSVSRWIRNTVGGESAFSLPTPSGNFYPDFIAELTNGKILVVEYKGEQLRTNDDSRMKNRVGLAWEKASGGRCFFLMAVKRDSMRRNVAAQIQAKIDEAMESSA